MLCLGPPAYSILITTIFDGTHPIFIDKIHCVSLKVHKNTLSLLTHLFPSDLPSFGRKTKKYVLLFSQRLSSAPISVFTFEDWFVGTTLYKYRPFTGFKCVHILSQLVDLLSTMLVLARLR